LSSLLKIPVSILFIIFSLTASGGDPYRPSPGAAEAGMGYACIMKKGFWSAFHNQATLAFNNSFCFGFNYQNRFGLSELGTRSAGLIIPAGKASMGAIYKHFGYADFKRSMTGLACGIKLSGMLAAGIEVDYFSEKAGGEYFNYQSVTCEAGLLITPDEKTRIGIHVFNPVPNSLRKSCMPTRLRVGVGTDLNQSLFAGLEAEMSSGSRLILKTGFEYEAVKHFNIRSGFSTENNSFSFGVGWLIKMVMVDLGFLTHERLGLTSSASLIFKIH
jgi:hypothetical protein